MIRFWPRCFHVHERQRHELSEAAGFFLQIADAQQVSRPVGISIDMAEHDRGGGAQADGVRIAHHIEPLFGVHLVRTDDGADLVVEDLGRRARQGR